MKIKRLFLHFILILFIISFVISKASVAEELTQEVTFIYVPGILSTNYEKTENDVKTLHKHFANKQLGKYKISPRYKMVDWGQVPREDKTYQLFQDGLIAINTAHNQSSCKKTSKSNLSLLFNPIHRFLLFNDSGSSANAVYWRNNVHNHLYDVVWFFLNNDNRDKVFSLIQDKINETDNNFVLIGNSLGAIIAEYFVFNDVIPDESDARFNEQNYKKFVGLITTADAGNTVLAPVWVDHFSLEDYKQNQTNFAKSFVENDKFWISLNHRSDILSTGLAPDIMLHNNEGNGFIVSEINTAGPLRNFIQAFKLWDRSNGLLKSHNWCFYNPKEFTKNVLRMHRENSIGK